jgi:Leucine-rich repeat (LRR) protein
MKALIPILIGLLVVCLPLAGADKKPLTKEESAKVIEAAIRKAAKKPTGELTKADLEKVERLNLRNNQLTEVKGLEKLTQLPELHLSDNPDLTKAQIAQLQQALPKCKINHNAKK